MVSCSKVGPNFLIKFGSLKNFYQLNQLPIIPITNFILLADLPNLTEFLSFFCCYLREIEMMIQKTKARYNFLFLFFCRYRWTCETVAKDLVPKAPRRRQPAPTRRGNAASTSCKRLGSATHRPNDALFSWNLFPLASRLLCVLHPLESLKTHEMAPPVSPLGSVRRPVELFFFHR